jgi:hypothetical protein
LKIEYIFHLKGGKIARFPLAINEASMEVVLSTDSSKPDWTRLEFHQCPNCPLDPETQPFCPLSLSLNSLMHGGDQLISYDTLAVEVQTPQRRVHQITTAQEALSALMGLIIATSGCPHTAFFKPMARFHLPMADLDETIFRAASMYLTAQYFISRSGGKADLELEGLKDIYKNIQVVNRSIADRLREVSSQDGMVNGLIILDLFAKEMPPSIDEALESLKPLFSAYLEA